MDSLHSGQLFGKFRIVQLLGEGGMGTVYLAQDNLQRQVALKIPKKTDPESLARFAREMKLAARIQHPNLCQLYEAGEINGTPYAALEYIQGHHLSELLQTGCSLIQAAEVVTTLARVLQVLHDQGIIHRDLKPSNVMVRANGTLVLLDFGLAKQTDAATMLTRAGAILGTPAYMAPEQIDAEMGRVGVATDVWALGVLFYQLLTGRTPFFGDSAPQLLAAILASTPAPPSRLRPEIPRDWDEACKVMLAKQPHARPQNMEAVLRLFGNFSTIALPVPNVVKPKHSRVFLGALAVAALLAGVALGGGLSHLGQAAPLASSGTEPAPSPQRTEQEQRQIAALEAQIASLITERSDKEKALLALRDQHEQRERSLLAEIGTLTKARREVEAEQTVLKQRLQQAEDKALSDKKKVDLAEAIVRDADKVTNDKIFTTLRDVINAGADRYNKLADYKGTACIYEGALLTLKPLLSHRMDLQKAIDAAITEAERTEKIFDKAFVLRRALDKIRDEFNPNPRAVVKPLWERMGGEPIIINVVDDFLAASAADPKVDFFRGGKFKRDDMEVAALKKHLVTFLSVTTGGPLKYTGKSMKEAHRGMEIQPDQFDAALAHLRTALEKNGVKKEDATEVINLLAKSKENWVEKK